MRILIPSLVLLAVMAPSSDAFSVKAGLGQGRVASLTRGAGAPRKPNHNVGIYMVNNVNGSTQSNDRRRTNSNPVATSLRSTMSSVTSSPSTNTNTKEWTRSPTYEYRERELESTISSGIPGVNPNAVNSSRNGYGNSNYNVGTLTPPAYLQRPAERQTRSRSQTQTQPQRQRQSQRQDQNQGMELPSNLTRDVSPFTNPRSTPDIISEIAPQTVTVQGGSLRVCSFSEQVDRISIYLSTLGRPLNSKVELWHGPDHTPQRMEIYLEDGGLRPFRAILECPGSSSSNSVAIRNTGQMEFPLTAGLEVDTSLEHYGPNNAPANILMDHTDSSFRPIQGGAVFTTPFAPDVSSVQIALCSDGRPIHARVELLQGPNNNKQVMEVYTEDGNERPFYMIVETPGEGNVVRVVNTATVEFPLMAAIEPYLIDEDFGYDNDNEYRGRGDGGMSWDKAPRY